MRTLVVVFVLATLAGADRTPEADMKRRLEKLEEVRDNHRKQDETRRRLQEQRDVRRRLTEQARDEQNMQLQWSVQALERKMQLLDSQQPPTDPAQLPEYVLSKRRVSVSLQGALKALHSDRPLRNPKLEADKLKAGLKTDDDEGDQWSEKTKGLLAQLQKGTHLKLPEVKVGWDVEAEEMPAPSRPLPSPPEQAWQRRRRLGAGAPEALQRQAAEREERRQIMAEWQERARGEEDRLRKPEPRAPETYVQQV